MSTNSPNLPIYLDYQATTPVDPKVMEIMVPFFAEVFGNAHSEHSHGQTAAEATETARAQIAALIGAEAREIVFTSGATESNNLAIKGAARFALRHKGGAHLVTCATEHKCVLQSCFDQAIDGVRTTVLPVGSDGLIEPNAIADAIEDDTVLVSIMAANNEIGVVQPIAEIGAICRERGVYFHTDAAQAVGKIPLDVGAMNIDLLSISGHKVYGPKGIGALYVRRRPRVRLEAMISGGGQERQLRSGTLPVSLCVGLGAACAVASENLADDEPTHLAVLRDRLLAGVRNRIPDVQLNGNPAMRIAGNLNLSFPGINVAQLLASLEDISVSSGSACTADDVEPSYVLRALGLPDELAAASLRLCIGRTTTEAEVDYAIDYLSASVERLRGESKSNAAE